MMDTSIREHPRGFARSYCISITVIIIIIIILIIGLDRTLRTGRFTKFNIVLHHVSLVLQ